ncbi:MAG: family 10 glycosylhydrolase, partial [Bacteroidota bacterium]|nr:family 10 glycosylhydrolase [Bacteroidota bacterium]
MAAGEKLKIVNRRSAIITWVLWCLPFIVSSLYAEGSPPKREFRGVWIATVANIDWPLHKGEPPAVQQRELISILDNLKSSGINAVIFQVRPECDALYRSSIEPWSYWLTGEQGKPPEPVWDPLHFAIEQAHKRGMELHAWFNPYRAVRLASGKGSYPLAPNHVAVRHPDWILTFGALKLLNPGLPAVRTYVTNVILDVVRRYDVDGIHFDDYFYPYSPITNEDSLTFLRYSRGFTNLADWRRDNVNLLIKMIHDSISVIKPWVKFGISPFGIWRNKIADGGAGTNGFEAYDKLYCDALEWLRAGT